MSCVILSGQHVRNLQGTSACDPRGSPDTWKQFWIQKTGRHWPHYCSINGCNQPAHGGGHVEINGRHGEVYIIPMCQSCNTPQNQSWMTVKPNTLAVKVERSNTTGPYGYCY